MGFPGYVKRKLASEKAPPCPVCGKRLRSWQSFHRHLFLHCRFGKNKLAWVSECHCCGRKAPQRSSWEILFHLIDLHRAGLLENHVIQAASLTFLEGDD